MSSRQILLFAAFISVLMITLNYSDVYTNSIQPVPGRTGGPGDSPGACAGSGCHTGTAPIFTTTAISMLSLGANSLANGYATTTNYNISITVSDFTKSRFGFQVMALDTNDVQAGSFTVTDAVRTVISPQNGREYMSHKNADGTTAWAFIWTSPATDVGPVTFYIAANAANNNDLATGDQIYTTRYKVSTSSGLAVDDGNVGVFDNLNVDDAGFVDIYPNPVQDKMVVDYYLDDNANVSIELYNINGQIIKELKSETMTAGTYVETFNIKQANVATGLYLVRFSLDGESYFKKLMVE